MINSNVVRSIVLSAPAAHVRDEVVPAGQEARAVGIWPVVQDLDGNRIEAVCGDDITGERIAQQLAVLGPGAGRVVDRDHLASRVEGLRKVATTLQCGRHGQNRGASGSSRAPLEV